MPALAALAQGGGRGRRRRGRDARVGVPRARDARDRRAPGRPRDRGGPPAGTAGRAQRALLARDPPARAHALAAQHRSRASGRGAGLADHGGRRDRDAAARSRAGCAGETPGWACSPTRPLPRCSRSRAPPAARRPRRTRPAPRATACWWASPARCSNRRSRPRCCCCASRRPSRRCSCTGRAPPRRTPPSRTRTARSRACSPACAGAPRAIRRRSSWWAIAASRRSTACSRRIPRSPRPAC